MSKSNENRTENADLTIYTIKDVMVILKIGRDRAYALFQSRNFPSTRIGGTLIVTKANLIRWLNENAGRCISL